MKKETEEGIMVILGCIGFLLAITLVISWLSILDWLGILYGIHGK